MMSPDCEWSEWTEEEACDRSCGGGRRLMTRRTVSGGYGCGGDQEERRHEPCHTHPCPATLAAITVPPVCLVLVVAVLGCYGKLGKRIRGAIDIPLITFPDNNNRDAA